MSELAQPFDVHPNQIQDWKKRLMNSAEEVLGERALSQEDKRQESEKLHEMIGRLTMKNDFLAKTLGRDC